ncbi:MAG: type II toxin-antitoxin system VapC family toxin [Bacteroidota bacterium]
MTILLDSHVYLWVADERFNHKLSKELKEMIADGDTEVYVSIVSIWELTIKLQKHWKTFEFDNALLNVDEYFPFEILTVTADHVQQLLTLDADPARPIHRDPFDRIMLAQAIAEGLTFVTHDSRCLQYAHPELALLDATTV